MRWVKRIAVGLAAVLVVAVVASAVGGTWAVRRSFPTTSGEETLPGLSAPVEVLRDSYGVPTIVASTSEDLFRAQGYVHAQDRFWEMDMRRHVTAGRVSELFGSDQVDTDRFIRTLGWRRLAEEEVHLLDEATQQMLIAYAEGVNAWMDGRSGSQLSFEHSLLRLTGAGGYEPEPWTPADSVAWLKAMAWDLRSNLEDELTRARLVDVDLGTGRHLDDLYPLFPEDRNPVILPEGGTVEDGRFVPEAGVSDPEAPELQEANAGPPASFPTGPRIAAALGDAHEALLAAPQLLGDGSSDGIGSNSWVVSPERSTTGSALLANDPHLGPSQPSLWYQVGLRCDPVGPDCPYEVAGFSFSGVPGVVIGHNARFGWGFTNLGADVTDLIIEHVDDDRYLTEDGWQPLDIHEETIRVAGGDDVPVTIRWTRNGPLFSDVSGGGADIAEGSLGGGGATGGGAAADADASEDDQRRTGDEYAVALRWAALEPTATMDAVIGFMLAEDWPSFRDAASDFEVPSQSIVYADVDGNIGYQAPGRIPVRRTGDGTVPLVGWTGEATWERYLDFEELPWTLNPEAGYLATANQPVLPPGTEPFIGIDVNRGQRGARIVELLEARDQHSPGDLLAMQMDNHNANAAALVAVLTDVDAQGNEGVQAIQALLAGWNLQDDAGSSAAAAFNVTWSHVLRLMFHEVLPEWAWPDGSGRWWEVVRGLVDEPDSAWWDDPTGEASRTRDDVLHAAMTAAHDELTATFSDDPDDWAWGELHTLTLTHGTFGTSGIGPVERLFNRGPLETSGGSDIVNANGWHAARGYEVVWVPSMRMVLDLGDLDAGRWIHLTGQSGRPFHRHYTDQAELWRDGQTIPITFSLEATRAVASEGLTLRP